MKRIFALIIVIVSGCGSPLEDNIQERYANVVQRLGIVPVYPPREEFQVGDIYLVSLGYNSSTGKIDYSDSSRVWAGELPQVADASEAFMATRIVFQPGTKTDGTQPDLYQSGLNRRADLHIDSLPISAFPTITADEGFSTGIGIANSLHAIGLGGGQRTKIRLDFADVRSYWVEKIFLTRYLRQRQTSLESVFLEGLGDFEGLHPTLQEREQIDDLSRPNFSSDRCIQFIVVSRVYLTRQINFTYSNGKIIAAGIRRSGGEGILSESPAPPRVNVNVTVDTNTGAVTQGDSDSQLTTLRDQVDGLASDGADGGGVNFETWNALGITFSKTYNRPVAIGYEGISFGGSPPPRCFPTIRIATI